MHYALKAVYESHQNTVTDALVSATPIHVWIFSSSYFYIKTTASIHHVSFVKSQSFVPVQPFNRRGP